MVDVLSCSAAFYFRSDLISLQINEDDVFTPCMLSQLADRRIEIYLCVFSHGPMRGSVASRVHAKGCDGLMPTELVPRWTDLAPARMATLTLAN